MEPKYESKLIFEDRRGPVFKSWELLIDWTTGAFQSTKHAGVFVGNKFKSTEALKSAVNRYVERHKAEGIRVYDPQSHNEI